MRDDSQPSENDGTISRAAVVALIGAIGVLIGRLVLWTVRTLVVEMLK